MLFLIKPGLEASVNIQFIKSSIYAQLMRVTDRQTEGQAVK